MARRDPFGWIGTTIDNRFTVESLAGEGAFGVVYRGRHLGFDEPVAIKCLKVPDDMEYEQRVKLLSTFQTEGRLLHRLSRRTTGIVQALDVGAAESPSGAWTPFIVMEWLEGETLESETLRRKAAGLPTRTVEQATELLAPAAAALAIAHSENVSHRDIKPGNLFLARSGESRTLKIVDFGIAKVLEISATMSQLRGTGGSIQAFTPQYGAPEQFNERYGATGPWTDVYAMALLLIELAAGRPALAGADVMKLYVASCDVDKRPSFASAGARATPAMEAMVRRALAVDPVARFRDMGEMLAAWTQAATGTPLAMTLPATEVDRLKSVAPPAATGRPSSAGLQSWQPSIQTGAAPGAGENRLCTIMFADISGFTQLSERLDPEDVKEVIDGCFRALTERIEKMGGVIDKFIGDCVMALFGVPRASENDAERAVRAALEMRSALAAITFPQRSLRQFRLAMRIGINTGRVFAGTVGGTSRKDVTVIGDAVNVAARLQQNAPEGAIVIGRDTYRQVAGLFEMEPLAPIEAKGKAGALIAYRVSGPAPARPAVPPTDFYGLATKLCGRSAEMQRLRDAVEGVTADCRASLITLVGPPGVGRSRLLAELSALLVERDEAFVTLSAQCSSLGASTAYGLAASLVRGRFHVLEDDAPEVVRSKLRRGMPPGVEVHDAIEEVAQVLGARPARAPGSDSIAPSEVSRHSKNRIAAAFARILGALAERSSVAIVCDDVQWADEASLDLLDDLVVRLAEAPLLIACSSRHDLFERRPHWGEGESAHARVDLGPLARRHIEEMIKDRLRLVEALSPDFVRVLADRADGNPLTLQESLSLLIDLGIIERSPEGPWVTHEETLRALALPATMQGIVQARLDRLDPDARAVLAQAAVIGKTFWEGAVESLREIAGPATTERPPGAPPSQPPASRTPSTTPEILAQLRDRQLIRVRAASTFPGERELTFADAATQEVAYETLSLKVRRPLHRRVAAWLEERGPNEHATALVALHHDRGGDPRRAALEYGRAAGHASQLGQNAEALRLLNRAKAIHEESETELGGGSPSHITWTADPDEVRVAAWQDRTRLRLDRGDVLRRIGRLDEAEAEYEEARRRILRQERRTGARLDATEVTRWEARIDYRLALTQKVRGRAADARALVQRALGAATTAGAIDETPAMWAALAGLHRRERDLDACRRASLEGLRVARGVKQRDDGWREAVSQLLVTLGAVFYSRGQMLRAERCYKQAARAVDENTQAASFALNNVAATRFARGDYAGAREMFLRHLAVNERLGEMRSIAIAHSNLAQVCLRLDDAAAALEHARRAVRLGEQVHADSDLPDMYRGLAAALLTTGRAVESLEVGCRALEAAARGGGGQVYLGDVALALARTIRAVSNDPAAGADARARAAAAREMLEARLTTHFGPGAGSELEGHGAACRAELAACEGRASE